MVEVPDGVMARHIIMQAYEYGEYADVYDTAAEGEFGQHEYETDWSVSEMDPESCEVEMVDETTVSVRDTIEALYSVQVRSATRYPNRKAHPAEYETRSIDLEVEIIMDLDELPQPIISAR